MNLEQNAWWSQFLTDVNGVILDVRTEEEVNTIKIPGSINIDIYKGQGFIYKLEELDKAKNYILRQGRTQFSEGGLGHDLINAIVKYGAIPEAIYSGAKPATSNIPSKFASKVTTETKPIAEVKSSDAPTTIAEHNHVKLITSLKGYLDSIIGLKIIPENWDTGFERILDTELGVAPSKFIYDGKR